MRRKPEFPTRDEWLARRGAPASPEQASPEPRLAGGEASEATDVQGNLEPDEQARLLGSEEPAKPVISLRPKRPYWR